MEIETELLKGRSGEQTTNHFLFNIFAFGGGVGGGAALKGKGNGGGMHARSGSGARPEAQSNSNAYASRSHHHALRAASVSRSLSRSRFEQRLISHRKNGLRVRKGNQRGYAAKIGLEKYGVASQQNGWE